MPGEYVLFSIILWGKSAATSEAGDYTVWQFTQTLVSLP